MRKLYLNRDLANAKKDIALTCNQGTPAAYYVEDNYGNSTFYIGEEDVDMFIEAGFIREEIAKEFTRQDMIDFGNYMLDVYNFSDKSSSVNDLVYFLKGR